MISAIVAAAAAITGAVISGIIAHNDRKAKEKMQAKALELLDGVNVPDEEKMKIKAQILDDTAFDQIINDPTFEAAQKNSMATLQQMAATGYTPTDKDALNSALEQASGEAAAQRKAITSNAQQRGIGGSGMEIGSALAAQQQTAQTGANAARAQALDALQRQLSATTSLGQLGTQMRSQDYAEKSNKAQAQDAIARFNAQQRGAADMYNSGLVQQGYNNQLGLAQDKANAALNQAASYGASQNANTQLAGGLLTTAGQQIGNAATDYYKTKKAGSQTPGTTAY